MSAMMIRFQLTEQFKMIYTHQIFINLVSGVLLSFKTNRSPQSKEQNCLIKNYERFVGGSFPYFINFDTQRGSKAFYFIFLMTCCNIISVSKCSQVFPCTGVFQVLNIVPSRALIPKFPQNTPLISNPAGVHVHTTLEQSISSRAHSHFSASIHGPYDHYQNKACIQKVSIQSGVQAMSTIWLGQATLL